MSWFGDTLTDRIARRPSGLIGRLLYRHPIGHQRSFDMALAALALDAGDILLEVGCGGGVFLQQALASGCCAGAIDHSPDMVASTLKLNAKAVQARRLVVHEADAAVLPFAADTFTKAACLNAFFFCPDPVGTLREMARVLRPAGFVVVFTATPHGQAAANRLFGPIAKRMRFDAPDQLKKMSSAAGFVESQQQLMPDGAILHIAKKESL
jgi:SAM-dependent methyltransferase